MKLATLRLFSFAAISLLIGCGSGSNSTSTSFSSDNLTGDWAFGITDPPSSGPFAITQLNGALSGSGQNITGVFQAVDGTGCVSPTFAITFTGSQDSSGNLTLTSTNLPNNVATITASGTEFADGNVFVLAGLSITGSGPCAESIALLGGEVIGINGTYSGSLTASSSGASTPFTISLSEGAANSSGQFPTTGTVTVTGSSCTNVLSLTGFVSGLSLSGNLTSTSGPAATGTLSITSINSVQSGSQQFTALITSTGCNGNLFSGPLTKQ